MNVDGAKFISFQFEIPILLIFIQKRKWWITRVSIASKHVMNSTLKQDIFYFNLVIIFPDSTEKK